MEKEILIKENDLIRVYSVEEWNIFFGNKEYISIIDLINVKINVIVSSILYLNFGQVLDK